MAKALLVLRFLADDRRKWALAAMAALASIVFFFQLDRALLALLAAVVSFVALPAGVMARSMIDRGLPKAPVASGMAGIGLGVVAGSLLACRASTNGLVGVAGALAALIVAPLLGFLVLGGIANLVESGRAARRG